MPSVLIFTENVQVFCRSQRRCCRSSLERRHCHLGGCASLPQQYYKADKCIGIWAAERWAGPSVASKKSLAGRLSCAAVTVIAHVSMKTCKNHEAEQQSCLLVDKSLLMWDFRWLDYDFIWLHWNPFVKKGRALFSDDRLLWIQGWSMLEH